MSGMVAERRWRRQTGMYAGMDSSITPRNEARHKKARSEDRAILALRSVRECGAARRGQRCAAMLRACAAALFSAATGGTLPSKASVSSLFSTGSMRS